MRFAIAVEVTAIPGIADPEAATIERSLPLLGFDTIAEMRVGRMFRFALEAPDAEAARDTAEDLAHRLLANPVIQRYAVSVGPPKVAGAE